MKKYFGTIILFTLLLSSTSLLKAEDLLPSDAYYKNNIAVNNVTASSPSLRAPGDPDFPDPGGDLEGGGGQVNAPIGDATLPILVAGILYGSFILFRNKKKESVN